MGIKNNFEKALKKATSKDPIGYKAILDEDHDCEKIHPQMTHEEWSKTKEEEMGEATTSASAGAFMAPMGMDPRFAGNKKKKKKKEAKTQFPGGKFVKVKERCKKFPYCNQGDINALELTDNKMVKAAITEVAKKTGKDRTYIKELVKKEIEEIIRRSIYKSPITSLVGTGKMNTPIGQMYSMGSNVGGKYE